MTFRDKIVAGLSATLPAVALGAFMATAPPRAEADCTQGCYAGGYYSCGYCLSQPCGAYPGQQCSNNQWICGCC